ncbi:MAG TPA: hypothetical protein VKU41_07430, partial [Polyangiaceae bacterium]|nr:hypothetical protein [Polyangiaceae bacterium]
SKELADNSQVVNIGRIQDGSVSTTDLFVSTPVSVMDGATAGYDFDYSAQDIIESGDSGGPDEVPASSPHLIVAVNSGGGTGEVLARTDPPAVYKWILQQIAAHGGGCSDSDAGTSDAGVKDASTARDATGGGTSADAAASETGAADARASDASPSSSGGRDAGSRAGTPTGNRSADGSAARVADASAGLEEGSDAAADNATFPSAASSSGCSCRAAQAPSRASDVLGAAIAVAAVARTRRRRGVERDHEIAKR